MTELETKFGIFEFVILKLFRIFYCYCLIAEIIAMSFLVLKLTIQGLQALWTERQLTQLSTSLIPTIQEGIEPGRLVRIDDWNGYIGLSSKGYNHIVMRLSANVGENLLPLAHRVAALLKKWLQGTHQGAVRGFHLDFYLDEFTFRFNRRTSRSRGKLFFRLIQQAVNIEPVKGRDIRGNRLHK